MKTADLESDLKIDLLEIGELLRELYPICRSITGTGVRSTLKLLRRHLPLDLVEVPTGTPALDWTVPREWNIRGAHIMDPQGRVVVDFADHNLHVMGYSIPVRERMPLAELREHIFTLPDHPEWIPYRTSYHHENWGFCMTHRQLETLPDGQYEVCIDSSLEDGSLTYGECLIRGETEEEVLISCHICHPSLANDNVAGMVLAALLGRHLMSRRHRYSYRFVFAPATIGAIVWLSRNEEDVHRIRHGLVVACVGDPGGITYKKSRRGDAEIDHAVIQVLRHREGSHEIEEFFPYGYDERQYCSPGFNLPVGCLMRTPHGRYPEYHTSADNLQFVKEECVKDSLEVYLSVCNVLEGNRVYLNTHPKGEPQLGRRGLYRSIGGTASDPSVELAMLWVLNQSDGTCSLLEIADQAGMDFRTIRAAADLLIAHDLLKECEEEWSQ